MKRLFILALSLLLLLSIPLSGCSKADEALADPEAPATGSPPSANATPTASPEPTPLPYVNPLNGIRCEEDPGNRRPVALMINNISFAMPQCGISNADIIYEALAEGGVTRMFAIFSDLSAVADDESVTFGSMRSIRPYFVEIGLAYDAIIVHAGGSEQAYSDIKFKGADNIDGVRGPGSAAFKYDKSRQTHGIEHSLFTTPAKILEQIEALEYETEHFVSKYDYGLRFTDGAEKLVGKAAATIDVDFGKQKMTYLEYNEEKGVYNAKQHNQDYIDGDSGEKVAFDNIIIIYADTRVIDNYGRRTIDLDGEGGGHYAYGGKYIDISWSHGVTGSQFKYTRADGSELTLRPGKTYIAVVPAGSDIIFG